MIRFVTSILILQDVCIGELRGDGLTRGPLEDSDMLSSVTLVSLTLSTEGCLLDNFLVLRGGE